MADRVDKETRSRIMSRIGSVSAYEAEVAELVLALTNPHLEMRRNAAELPGCPDLYFPRARLAVFVHGCFWHGCPRHYRAPKTNRAFWERKVRTNRERDRRVLRQLRAAGLRTMVIWTHADPEAAAVRVALRYFREIAVDSRR